MNITDERLKRLASLPDINGMITEEVQMARELLDLRQRCAELEQKENKGMPSNKEIQKILNDYILQDAKEGDNKFDDVYKWLDELLSALTMMMWLKADSIRRQVSELEQERDDWRKDAEALAEELSNVTDYEFDVVDPEKRNCRLALMNHTALVEKYKMQYPQHDFRIVS